LAWVIIIRTHGVSSLIISMADAGSSEAPRGKRDKMGLNEKAAAAAEARVAANAMSVAELRTALSDLGVASASAIEKNDLVVLFVRAKTSDVPLPPLQAKAATAAPLGNPWAAQAKKPASKVRPVGAPEEVNWTNAVLLGLVAIYMYFNFFAGGGDGGGGGSGPGGVGEYTGARSLGYLSGAVIEVRTKSEFDKLIQQHAEDTGLPVVVDFHSKGCGPCRQIAPYYSALAEELKGKACFLKVRKRVGLLQGAPNNGRGWGRPSSQRGTSRHTCSAYFVVVAWLCGVAPRGA
jgi:hypothetical protein